MIGEQAIGADPHRPAFKRLFDRPLKRLEIGVFKEHPHPVHASVQDMEKHSAGS
jgi:hypothetical protein